MSDQPEIIAPTPRQMAQRARREREARGDGAATTIKGPEAPDEKARPETPKRRKAAPKSESDIKAEWAKSLFGGHQIAAMFTGIPMLVITKDEAEALAGPLIETLQMLGIPVDGSAWPPLSLLITAGMIYGPRFKAFIDWQEANRAAEAAKPAEAHEVHGEAGTGDGGQVFSPPAPAYTNGGGMA